jgi:carbonic anhydrase
LLQDVKATSDSQHPIAVVLGCIDSRVPVETIFDMGVGDMFCVRVAGNVVSKDIIASIEFACCSGAKLIVVLGHTRCGAILAANDGVKEGYITELLNKIKPAIATVKKTGPLKNQEFLLAVTEQNIQHSIQALFQGSEIIREQLKKQAIEIIGAVYHVEDGKVVFLSSDNLKQF